MSQDIFPDSSGVAVTVPGGVDVTDRAGRALGIVSAAALPLPAGAATEATIAAILARYPGAAVLGDATANPTVSQIGTFPLTWNGATWDRQRGDATNGLKIMSKKALHNGQTNGVNTAGTSTLGAPGAGLFYYIWAIKITRVATAAVAGGAILTYTTTQLNGMAWIAGNAIAAGGTAIDADESWATPIRSDTVNTAVTVVAPAGGAATTIRIEIVYHVGPDQA